MAERRRGVLDRWAARCVALLPWWSAGLALIVFAVFVAVVLPGQAAASEAYTSRFPAPDTRWWYAPADLTAAAEAWGAEGRAAYVRARFTFDLVWPLVYGAFLLTGLTRLWGRAVGPGSRWRRVILLPVLAVALDYAENVAAAVTVARFPAATPVLAQLAPVFTLGKWLVLSASFLLLAVGAVLAVVALLRGRRG